MFKRLGPFSGAIIWTLLTKDGIAEEPSPGRERPAKRLSCQIQRDQSHTSTLEHAGIDIWSLLTSLLTSSVTAQRAPQNRPGVPGLTAVMVPALSCSRHLHFCDVKRISFWTDVSVHSDVLSFVALKNLRIVHIPRSLVGHKR